MSSSVSDKILLRKQCLRVRDGLDAAMRAAVDKIICDKILATISGSGMIVAGYYAIGSETNISQALSGFYKNNTQICLPMIVSRSEPLRFRRYIPGMELVAGAHGTLVPPVSEPELTPDVVLVPLVGFDEAGHRLGYGAGYYDRTIAHLRARNKNVRIIGVGYAIQRVAHIPAEAHDEKLGEVITEN